MTLQALYGHSGAVQKSCSETLYRLYMVTVVQFRRAVQRYSIDSIWSQWCSLEELFRDTLQALYGHSGAVQKSCSETLYRLYMVTVVQFRRAVQRYSIDSIWSQWCSLEELFRDTLQALYGHTGAVQKSCSETLYRLYMVTLVQFRRAVQRYSIDSIWSHWCSLEELFRDTLQALYGHSGAVQKSCSETLYRLYMVTVVQFRRAVQRHSIDSIWSQWCSLEELFRDTLQALYGHSGAVQKSCSEILYRLYMVTVVQFRRAVQRHSIGSIWSHWCSLEELFRDTLQALYGHTGAVQKSCSEILYRLYMVTVVQFRRAVQRHSIDSIWSQWCSLEELPRDTLQALYGHSGAVQKSCPETLYRLYMVTVVQFRRAAQRHSIGSIWSHWCSLEELFRDTLQALYGHTGAVQKSCPETLYRLYMVTLVQFRRAVQRHSIGSIWSQWCSLEELPRDTLQALYGHTGAVQKSCSETLYRLYMVTVVQFRRAAQRHSIGSIWSHWCSLEELPRDTLQALQSHWCSLEELFRDTLQALYGHTGAVQKSCSETLYRLYMVTVVQFRRAAQRHSIGSIWSHWCSLEELPRDTLQALYGHSGAVQKSCPETLYRLYMVTLVQFRRAVQRHSIGSIWSHWCSLEELFRDTLQALYSHTGAVQKSCSETLYRLYMVTLVQFRRAVQRHSIGSIWSQWCSLEELFRDTLQALYGHTGAVQKSCSETLYRLYMVTVVQFRRAVQRYSIDSIWSQWCSLEELFRDTLQALYGHSGAVQKSCSETLYRLYMVTVVQFRRAVQRHSIGSIWSHWCSLEELPRDTLQALYGHSGAVQKSCSETLYRLYMVTLVQFRRAVQRHSIGSIWSQWCSLEELFRDTLQALYGHTGAVQKSCPETLYRLYMVTVVQFRRAAQRHSIGSIQSQWCSLEELPRDTLQALYSHTGAVQKSCSETLYRLYMVTLVQFRRAVQRHSIGSIWSQWCSLEELFRDTLQALYGHTGAVQKSCSETLYRLYMVTLVQFRRAVQRYSIDSIWSQWCSLEELFRDTLQALYGHSGAVQKSCSETLYRLYMVTVVQFRRAVQRHSIGSIWSHWCSLEELFRDTLQALYGHTGAVQKSCSETLYRLYMVTVVQFRRAVQRHSIGSIWSHWCSLEELFRDTLQALYGHTGAVQKSCSEILYRLYMVTVVQFRRAVQRHSIGSIWSQWCSLEELFRDTLQALYGHSGAVQKSCSETLYRLYMVTLVQFRRAVQRHSIGSIWSHWCSLEELFRDTLQALYGHSGAVQKSCSETLYRLYMVTLVQFRRAVQRHYRLYMVTLVQFRRAVQRYSIDSIWSQWCSLEELFRDTLQALYGHSGAVQKSCSETLYRLYMVTLVQFRRAVQRHSIGSIWSQWCSLEELPRDTLWCP